MYIIGLVCFAALIAVIFGHVTSNLRQVFGAILAVLAVNMVRSFTAGRSCVMYGSHKVAYSMPAENGRCNTHLTFACRFWWRMLFQHTRRSQRSRIEAIPHFLRGTMTESLLTRTRLLLSCPTDHCTRGQQVLLCKSMPMSEKLEHFARMGHLTAPVLNRRTPGPGCQKTTTDTQ